MDLLNSTNSSPKTDQTSGNTSKSTSNALPALQADKKNHVGKTLVINTKDTGKEFVTSDTVPVNSNDQGVVVNDIHEANDGGGKRLTIVIIFLLVILLGSLGFIGFSVYSNPNSSISVKIFDILAGIGIDLDLDQASTESDVLGTSWEKPISYPQYVNPTKSVELDSGIKSFIKSFPTQDYLMQATGSFEYIDSGDNGYEVSMNLDNVKVYYHKGKIAMIEADDGINGLRKAIISPDGTYLIINDVTEEYFISADLTDVSIAFFYNLFSVNPIRILYQGLGDGSFVSAKIGEDQYQTRIKVPSDEKFRSFPATFTLDSMSNIVALTISDDEDVYQGEFIFTYSVYDYQTEILGLPGEYTSVN